MSASVLMIVDVQNDFLSGGALAVPDGDAVIPAINVLAARFDHVILTQDWRPPGHISFASSHPGCAVYDSLKLDDCRTQVLWPDRCLQGSPGAAIADGRQVAKAELVIRKGYRQGLDSYSAFNEADGTPTGLAGYLRERGLGCIVVVGLAIDFCAGFTAIHAAHADFETILAEDATRGIDVAGSMDRVRGAMAEAGVTFAGVAEVMG